MNEDRRDDAASADGAPEAGRYYGCDLPQDGALTEDGWEWRGNADERRSKDLVDMYSEVGFEVRLEPINVDAMCSASGIAREHLKGVTTIHLGHRTLHDADGASKALAVHRLTGIDQDQDVV